MKETLQTVGVVLLAIIVVLGVVWIAQGNDFFLYKVFAPKYEQVRRDTFIQSQAYNQGMISDLQKMRLEYERETDPKAKEALKSYILQTVAPYDKAKLPADLRGFINTLEGIPAEREVQ